MSTIHDLFNENYGESEEMYLEHAHVHLGDEVIEVPGYTPNRRELIQIVKYWAKEAVEIWYWEFVTETWDSLSAEASTFARHRIDPIRGLLGEKAVNEAIDEMCAELAKRKHWNIYLNGSDEQRKVLQEEYEQLILGDLSEEERKKEHFILHEKKLSEIMEDIPPEKLPTL